MKQHVIIFDGPDMCGKTEMAHELSDVLSTITNPIPYFKNESEWDFFEKDPGYFKNALKYGDTFFYSYLKQTNASVILDRSYPSEWVYSKIFMRMSDIQSMEKIDQLASDIGVKIIIPYRTSYEGLVDQFASITPDMLKKIEQKYFEFSEWTSCDTLLLNVDNEDLEEEMFEIVKFINNKNKER